MRTIRVDEKSVVVLDHDDVRHHDKVLQQLQRRRAYCAGLSVLPLFALILISLVVFDIVMETHVLPPPSMLINSYDLCTPKIVNASNVEYHSGHRYYSELQNMAPLPLPVFRDKHTKLCNADKREEQQYSYCLPIAGRKDEPFCAAADRMDLLNLRSSQSICYASVLHMIMVEVYEELQASGNIPFLAFGSLLGAVRNGSMIPFTEDADIGFVGDMIAEKAVKEALWRKGYHMFFMDIWRVCVAPTHPLAGHLYDPNLPITDVYAVPYLDLYKMKQLDYNDWDMEELEGSNGRILPDDKVQPFSQVTINGLSFDTVHDPVYFLTEAYGKDYMTPKPREA